MVIIDFTASRYMAMALTSKTTSFNIIIQF